MIISPHSVAFLPRPQRSRAVSRRGFLKSGLGLAGLAGGARFAYGHIVETGRHMIVPGRLGTSWVPIRLGMPPEIVRVELGA
jgi:predicted MPP superfamily phosphohydrolase